MNVESQKNGIGFAHNSKPNIEKLNKQNGLTVFSLLDDSNIFSQIQQQWKTPQKRQPKPTRVFCLATCGGSSRVRRDAEIINGLCGGCSNDRVSVMMRRIGFRNFVFGGVTV